MSSALSAILTLIFTELFLLHLVPHLLHFDLYLYFCCVVEIVLLFFIAFYCRLTFTFVFSYFIRFCIHVPDQCTLIGFALSTSPG